MMVMRDRPDELYEAEMRSVFGETDGPPRMDFVLLGMGGDCHTASLFPNSDAIHVSDRLIVVNDGPNVTPPPRVTMTYPLLNAARQLAVLCVGAKKTEALKRVADQMKTGPDPVNVPITGIQPTDGVLTWYLDSDAAGK
jgi:6-phosphogluconolactonase/glucosamine-6-phosphate isomerase/deaminase